MPEPGFGASEPAGMQGLLRILAGLEMDCGCRRHLDDALDRFGHLAMLRGRKHALAAARAQRSRIMALLALLSDLDTLPVTEPDGSVFAELADQFRDIAMAAGEAAARLRDAASGPERGP